MRIIIKVWQQKKPQNLEIKMKHFHYCNPKKNGEYPEIRKKTGIGNPNKLREREREKMIVHHKIKKNNE